MQINFFHEYPQWRQCLVDSMPGSIIADRETETTCRLVVGNRGTWIQLLYFIAFPARVRLLHARPVLQSDFNASLIISDLTRGVPLSLFHASGANGGGCYICMSEFSFQFNQQIQVPPPFRASIDLEFSGFSLFTERG